MLALATHNPQPFAGLVGASLLNTAALNKLYLSACGLIAVVMLAFYLAQKKHSYSNEVMLLSLLLANKARIIKHLKIATVLLLVLAAVFSLKGK